MCACVRFNLVRTDFIEQQMNSSSFSSTWDFYPGSRAAPLAASRSELEGNKPQNLTTVCFPGLDYELIPYDLDERDLKAGMVSACLCFVIMPMECAWAFNGLLCNHNTNVSRNPNSE